MTTAPTTPVLPDLDIDTIIDRLATIVVEHGANVQRGQTLVLGADLGQEQLTRAVVAAAYRRGAGFVDVIYTDPYVWHARIAHADPDTLEQYPDWVAVKTRMVGEAKCAMIRFSGATEPTLYDDLDPVLVGREQHVARRESMQNINDRAVNWSIIPCPTPKWSQLVHPELEADDAYLRLWREIAWVCRLDADDPVAAWRERMDQLNAASAALNAARFDAIRLVGPGTDLTVGLLPNSTWICADGETAGGIRHMPNLPSEEIFTTPDPMRADGVVRSTKPLFTNGAMIEGLEVEFRDGVAVRIDADRNAEVLRSQAAKDEGAARLGELALVDAQGRIGRTGTVFYDTLLDENAASHIALGAGYALGAGDDADRANDSSIHIDFMIGGPDVDVFGVTPDGAEVPVLIGGDWKV